jgi:hypothetical protein
MPNDEKTKSTDVAQAPATEPVGKPIRQVTFSRGNALYLVEGVGPRPWLSVQSFASPAPENLQAAQAAAGYLGAVTTADGKGWRKAYAAKHAMAIVAHVRSLPDDDLLVKDYAAALAALKQVN